MCHAQQLASQQPFATGQFLGSTPKPPRRSPTSTGISTGIYIQGNFTYPVNSIPQHLRHQLPSHSRPPERTQTVLTEFTRAPAPMAFALSIPLNRRQASSRTAVRSAPTCACAPQSHSVSLARRTMTRRTALLTLATSASALLLSDKARSESLEYKVVQAGSGARPELGDLVGIRFKGSYNGVVFDNLFNEPAPYFYRVGSGTILKVSSQQPRAR